MAAKWEKFSEQELKQVYDKNSNCKDFFNELGYKTINKNILSKLQEKYSWIIFNEEKTKKENKIIDIKTNNICRSIANKARNLNIDYEDYINIMKIKLLEIYELIPEFNWDTLKFIDGKYANEKYYKGIPLYLDAFSKIKNFNTDFISYIKDFFTPLKQNYLNDLYQYYFSKDKKEVDKKRKNNEGGKEKDDLDRTTQIFTPKYIVDYLSQTSLINKFSEYDNLVDKMNLINEKAIKMNFNFNDVDLDNFKIFEPCCGCGAFLPTILKLLIDIYNIKGIKNNLSNIIKNNLYFGDIDEKALDCAIFTVQLFAATRNLIIRRNELKAILYTNDFGFLDKSANFAKQKYDIIITNPPYCGCKNFNNELKEYTKKNYQLGKNDLSTCCIEQAMSLLKDEGIIAMITNESWMFLQSYKKLRQKIYNEYLIGTMLHSGRNIFLTTTIAATAFVLIKTNQYNNNNNGIYFRYVNVKDKEKQFQWNCLGFKTNL